MHLSTMCHLFEESVRAVILIGPKNTNFVEDFEILLPDKFRSIPFGGFRGEGCPKQFPNGGEGLFSKEERDMGKDQWMRKSIINKDQKYRYDCKVLDIMLV